MQQAKEPACSRQEPAGELALHFIHRGPRGLSMFVVALCFAAFPSAWQHYHF